MDWPWRAWRWGSFARRTGTQTLVLLARRRIPLLRTDEVGTVTIRSDGQHWEVTTERPGPRGPPPSPVGRTTTTGRATPTSRPPSSGRATATTERRTGAERVNLNTAT